MSPEEKDEEFFDAHGSPTSPIVFGMGPKEESSGIDSPKKRDEEFSNASPERLKEDSSGDLKTRTIVIHWLWNATQSIFCGKNLKEVPNPVCANNNLPTDHIIDSYSNAVDEESKYHPMSKECIVILLIKIAFMSFYYRPGPIIFRVFGYTVTPVNPKFSVPKT